MNNQNEDGSLEALVAADTGGGSGRPGGAQAPVAASGCASPDCNDGVVWDEYNRMAYPCPNCQAQPLGGNEKAEPLRRKGE